MTDKAEIFTKLKSVLVELFELEEGDITLESDLYNDLDIDSIDTVDLIVELKKFTGKKIDPEAYKQIRTVGDIVDSVHQLMNS